MIKCQFTCTVITFKFHFISKSNKNVEKLHFLLTLDNLVHCNLQAQRSIYKEVKLLPLNKQQISSPVFLQHWSKHLPLNKQLLAAVKKCHHTLITTAGSNSLWLTIFSPLILKKNIFDADLHLRYLHIILSLSSTSWSL